MLQKIFPVLLAAVLLSGCTLKLPFALPGTATTTGGSVWKSFDGGDTFVPKVVIDDKNKITASDVVSVAFDPTNAQTLYIGTLANGLLKTTDGAEHWKKLIFPPLKNYGLTIDRQNPQRLYVSGVLGGIAKIFRTDDAGENWREVYTEPGSGAVVTALASQPESPSTLYAGTSAGVMIKSLDGGETWKHLVSRKGAITKLVFERGRPESVTVLVLNQGVIHSTDGGKTWSDDVLKAQAGSGRTGGRHDSGVSMSTPTENPTDIVSLAADPTLPGVLYVGAKNGLFKSSNNGETWTSLPLLDSAKSLPLRALAVNPHNSQEIVYASGQAFYKSTDGGIRWATTELTIDRGVSMLEYSGEPGIIYLGLRKY